MINDKKILGIVPARGGSKGLPRKNIISLCGRPLLGWPIQTAKGSRFIDRVIVSTDDYEIAEKAIEQGAEVPFIRPAALASDKASSFSVVEHALSFLTAKGDIYDYIVLLEPTSPLTESEDIDAALEILHKSREIADSIISVSKMEGAHPAFNVVIQETGIIVPFCSSEFSSPIRRQDISDVYFFDGSLYISDVKVYLERKTFCHEKTLAYVTPKWKSIEVDDIVDLICVEAIIKNIETIKRETP